MRKDKTMRHTTFENELRDIRRRAINELRSALEAHDRKFNFEENDCAPILIDGAKILKAECYGKTLVSFTMLLPNEETECCNDGALYVEDILAITEAIPETDDVKDVSGVYPAPVTWVDCDDIESAGYDSEEVTQEQLGKIAERMGFGYVDSGEFYSSLSAVCAANGLKEKGD